MSKWLVVHDLEAFGENPRMLGFVGKRNLDGSPTLDNRGNPVPADTKVLKMKPGDLVVYYCRGDSVIKGLYGIVQVHYGKESKWPESPFQFEIEPVLELDVLLDCPPHDLPHTLLAIPIDYIGQDVCRGLLAWFLQLHLLVVLCGTDASGGQVFC